MAILVHRSVCMCVRVLLCSWGAGGTGFCVTVRWTRGIPMLLWHWGLELVVSAHSSLDSSSPLTILYVTLSCIMSYTTKHQQHRFPVTSLTLIPHTLWQPVSCASLACPSLRPNRKTVPIWPLQILAWWQCSPLSRIPPPTSLPLRSGRCEILIASLGIGLFLSVISDQNIILPWKYNYWDGRNMGVLLGGRGRQAWEDYWEGAMAFFLNHLSPVC